MLGLLVRWLVFVYSLLSKIFPIYVGHFLLVFILYNNVFVSKIVFQLLHKRLLIRNTQEFESLVIGNLFHIFKSFWIREYKIIYSHCKKYGGTIFHCNLFFAISFASRSSNRTFCQKCSLNLWSTVFEWNFVTFCNNKRNSCNL